MASPPTLSEVLRRALEAQRRDLHTAMPGRVTAVNTRSGYITSVDVQPVIRDTFEDEQGEQVTATIPVIPRVPVLFLGGGGYRVTVPIKRGDTVLLVFCEAAIDKWFATGGDADPDARRHHLSDAVAIPGLQSARSLYDVPTDALTIGRDGGAFEGVALGATLQAFLDTIRTAFNTHTHTDPVSGVTGTPSTVVGTVPTVASSTVRTST